MKRRVLFYVQHLMGVGHVFRAMRIVRKLVKRGANVAVIYGGEPVPNFDAGGAIIHYLPPLRGGSMEFHLLEKPDGSIADECYKNDRRERILSILEAFNPDAIIVEAFPFGRRQMRFELLPMLETAIAGPDRPLIVSSVRDILQERAKPGRHEETLSHIERFFDRILVHGDPAMVRLEETFPPANAISAKLHYTGIVAPDRAELNPDAEAFDVVVSVGGGMLGPQLLEAAVRAKPISPLADARWLIATGLGNKDNMTGAISEIADTNSRVVPFVQDLVSHLAKARLSISRCGYNTVADILVAGCRAIVSPLSDGVETEQLKRAEILARNELSAVLSPERQTPEALAAAIAFAMEKAPPDRSQIDIGGASKSAELIMEWLAERGKTKA
jgi:predicted glycosyltransferase